MARPIVLVYQELATISVTPVVPQLNTLIVGPAYVIKDYPEDNDVILLPDTYGLLNQSAYLTSFSTAYVPPTAGVTALTLNSYPGNAPGAIVNHASVRIYLRQPRVVLGATYTITGAPSLGTRVDTFNIAADKNKVQFGALTDLIALGIAVGDILIATDKNGLTVIRSILSVGEYGANNVLRVTQNFDSGAAWSFDTDDAGVRIERNLITQEYTDPDGYHVTFPDLSANTLEFKGGVLIPIMLNVSGVTSIVDRPLSYGQVYVAYCALRQDLQEIDSCTATEILTKVGKLDARNPLAVGLSIATQNCPSGTPILFYGVASDDIPGHALVRDKISARKDIFMIVPLTVNRDIIFAYKIDCAGLADPALASDTGIAQKFRVVMGSGALPVEVTVSPDSSNAVPQQSGVSSGKFRTINIVHPVASLTTLLPGDDVTIGMVPVAGTWASRRGTHKIGHLNSATQFEIQPGNIAWTNALEDAHLTVGAEIRITDAKGIVKYEKLAAAEFTHTASVLTITHKNPLVSGGPYRVQFVTGLARVATISGYDITLTYVSGDTIADAISTITATANIISVVTPTLTSGSDTDPLEDSGFVSCTIAAATSSLSVALNNNYYDIIQDDTATFLTSLVMPGDLLEIPVNPNDLSNSAFDGAFYTYTVNNIISENRVQILPTSDDGTAVTTEFPHAYSRSGSGLITITPPTAIRYRIQRALSKDDQVTALASIAQSFRDKRCALAWPDKVKVSGLTDGSLSRSQPTVPAVAGTQPGYYLACQIGGACAGLPPQQGLTNMGFAGIDKVYHATDYFTDRQLTRISDAGWFVLQQDTPTAAPYCIHQLTTDPTAVETGELSVVKDLDYISMYFVNILQNYIGRYNVTMATLTEINRGLSSGIEALKINNIARIGPPLIDAVITSLMVSPISSDRVEVYVEATIPRPLNRIGLHLVV
jgi:hypothetical protein